MFGGGQWKDPEKHGLVDVRVECTEDVKRSLPSVLKNLGGTVKKSRDQSQVFGTYYDIRLESDHLKLYVDEWGSWSLIGKPEPIGKLCDALGAEWYEMRNGCRVLTQSEVEALRCAHGDSPCSECLGDSLGLLQKLKAAVRKLGGRFSQPLQHERDGELVHFRVDLGDVALEVECTHHLGVSLVGSRNKMDRIKSAMTELDESVLGWRQGFVQPAWGGAKWADSTVRESWVPPKSLAYPLPVGLAELTVGSTETEFHRLTRALRRLGGTRVHCPSSEHWSGAELYEVKVDGVVAVVVYEYSSGYSLIGPSELLKEIQLAIDEDT